MPDIMIVNGLGIVKTEEQFVLILNNKIYGPYKVSDIDEIMKKFD
ncbi:hypothetical protein [Acinetobacter baumannii]